MTELGSVLHSAVEKMRRALTSIRIWAPAYALVVGMTAVASAPASAAGEAPEFAGLAGHAHPICTAFRQTHDPGSPICGMFRIEGRDTAADVLASQRRETGKQPTYPPWTPPMADFVLLGEVHDNPVHHWLRGLWAAERAKEAMRRPAAVFEQFEPNRQPVITRLLADRGTANGTAAPLPSGAALSDITRNFLEQVGWARSGWPAASIYLPLFSQILASRLPIVAGNAPRAQVRAVARQGLSVLTDPERERLQLATLLPKALAASLAGELKDSHCGVLPDRVVPNMAAAQIYRDAHMAAAMIEAARHHGSAMLFAGNGHIRRDRGVPWHVQRRAPGTSIIAVALIEVRDGVADPSAYVPRDPAGNPAVDYIVLTLRAVRPDPCEQMRRHMKSK